MSPMTQPTFYRTYVLWSTAGHFSDPLMCKRSADELNGKDFKIEGTVGSLDVVSIVAPDKRITEVKTIERIKLA